MKNYKKKLSFLLAAIPMLSNLGVAKAKNTELLKSNSGSINLENVPKEAKEDDSDTNPNSVALKMAEYAPTSLNREEKNRRVMLASGITERVRKAQKNSFEVITDMTVENYSSFAGSEFTDMLNSMQHAQEELETLATSMKDINRVLNSSDRFKIDEMIIRIDEKVKSLEDLVDDTRDRAWPELKKNMVRYEEQKRQSDSVKKAGLIRSCKAQCKRVRRSLGELENSLNTAVSIDPTMDALYAHIRENIKEVVNGLNRLDSQLANTKSLTIQTLQSMKETSQLYEDSADKLKADFGKMQAKSNSDSYANVLTDLGARVMKTEMSCENLTRMNIERRIMSDSQRQSLRQVKDELKKIFNTVKQEIQAVRDDATASRSLSKAMPNGIRRKLEDSVSEALGEAADHLRSWSRTIAAIESDDELRSQWNPQEMHRIMKQRMTRRCYEILTNNSWNISTKVKAIVAEINNVQPGTGTMVESAVRGILEYLSKGTPLTSVGEAVRGNLSGRSWLFTGEGGTGKSTAGELLAAAFNVKLIVINGADLRDSTKVFRILRDLTALTKPQTNPDNIVNFMVMIDEVDTGVCVATDSQGRSLELEGNENDLLSADDYGEDADATQRENTRVRKSKTWKLKTGRMRNTALNPSVSKNKNLSKLLSTALIRDPSGFRALSAIYNLLDSNTQSNMWALFSTSNFGRKDMPEEIARRLCPDTHEIAFRKPLKKEFIDIINKTMPNLSFSDGYDKTEGAARIAEQAEKNGLSAAELISTIAPIANAVRTPKDTSCALPAVGLCRLISGSITEGELVANARQLNYEEDHKTKARQETSITNDDISDDIAISKPYETDLRSFAPGIKITPPQS